LNWKSEAESQKEIRNIFQITLKSIPQSAAAIDLAIYIAKNHWNSLNLHEEDLPKNWDTSEKLIRLTGYSHTSDSRIQKKLLRLSKNDDDEDNLAKRATSALASMGVSDMDVVKTITEDFLSNPYTERSRSLRKILSTAVTFRRENSEEIRKIPGLETYIRTSLNNSTNSGELAFALTMAHGLQIHYKDMDKRAKALLQSRNTQLVYLSELYLKKRSGGFGLPPSEAAPSEIPSY
jgi:hypothetical protein